MRDERQRSLCAAFAELLSYPRDQVAAAAQRALELAGVGTEAEAGLRRFAASASANPAAWLEELYTATFDLAPACAPYVGHQLLGDSPMRGPFLAKLAEIFAADGFQPREDLADHVAEVLRFLAVARAGAAREELVQDGLVPALGRMIAALEDSQNPYRDVLIALRELLDRGTGGVERATEEVAR